MSNNGKKGAATWLFGFLTLLAGLNVFNALIQLNLNGATSSATFRILNVTLGSLNLEVYLWISVITTLLFFSVTSFVIYSGLPVDPQVLQRIAKVEENLANNSNMLENTQIGFFKKLEDNEKANDEVFRRMTLNLEGMKNEMLGNTAEQKKALQNMEEESRKNTEITKRQATELNHIKKKIERIEKETTPQKAKLTSETKLQNFKGISPSLAAKLKGIQITTVSELLASDSANVALKASEMVKTIADKQAVAQLLMVPGVDEKHAELLVKCGVTSRKELSDQDPVELYKGMVGIAKTYVEQGKMPESKVPTIEEVTSWIKQARL